MNAKLSTILSVPVIEQRSDAWFKSRLRHVTASEAASILGVCKYSSPDDTFFKKFGICKKFTSNVATQWGCAYEDVAIAHYCAAMGMTQNTVGLVSYEDIHGPDKMNSFLAGSADGIAQYICDPLADPVMLEVKCPYKRKIVPNQIPDHYYPQVQLNMYIYNLNTADYVEFCPNPFQLNIVRLYPDLAWLSENIPRLRKFYDDVQMYKMIGIHKHPLYPKYQKKYIT